MVGGFNGSSPISSTEILISGSDTWQIEDPLPISVNGIQAINFRNTILTFGNQQNSTE